MAAPAGRMTVGGGPGPHDLIAGYYTLSGSRAGAGEGEAARTPFETRVAAAARAGYVGLGLLVDDYEAMRANGASDADLRAILDAHGLRVHEIEFLYGWTRTDGREREAWRLEDRLYRMADRLHPRHLNLGDVDPPAGTPLELVAERFAGICDRAAEHGLLVALEFLPWSGIPDAARAWDVVRLAGRDNGGLNLDAWHHFRGARDDDALRSVPAERYVAIAIDDGDAEPLGDPVEDTTRRRRLPGQGAFDLVGFLRLLDDHGVAAPLTVEILSDEQNAMAPEDAAVSALRATRAVMAAARFRGLG